MSQLINGLNELSRLWWAWTWHLTWQAAFVAAIVFATLYFGRRWSAPVRYAILLVALLKFAVPPFIPAPTGVFTWAAPKVQPESRRLEARADGPVNAMTHQGNPASWAPEVAAETESEIQQPNTVRAPEPTRSAGVGKVGPAGTRALGWRAVLMILHTAGALLVFGWFVLQWLRLGQVRRGAAMEGQGWVVELFERLVNELQFRRRPHLVISKEISSPVAFGIVRPAVLLPEGLVSRFSAAELRTVLAHELAHIRRRDLWINALQLVLVACWWFHPAIWALNRAIRRAREDCCDDLLLARGLTSSEAYCEVLVRAARELVASEVNCAALGLGENLHPLGRRLRRIMDRTLCRSARLSFGGAVFALAAAWLLLPGLRSAEPGKTATARATDQSFKADNDRSGDQSAPHLEELFSSLRWVSDGNVFQEKMRRIARQMGPNAVPFLLGKIDALPSDPDDAKAVDARRNAVMALGFIGADLERVIPKLVHELEDDADLTYHAHGERVHLVRVSSVAADALGEIGRFASNAVPALIEAAGFGNGRALVALARIAPESPGVLNTLTNALGDFTRGQTLPQEGEYRMTALHALGVAAQANPHALRAFVSALDDGDPRFRAIVASRLVRMRADLPAAEERLTQVLEQGTPRQRTLLAAALAKAGSKGDRTYSTLLTGLRANNPEFLQPAVEGLALFGTRAAETVPVIAELAISEQGELRNAALQALVQIGVETPEVTGAVLSNLSAHDEMLRLTAMTALARMPNAARKAEAHLFELARHPEAMTRQAALNAIGQTRPTPGKALPVLKAALDDPEYGVASTALTSLGKFPEAADEIVPVMIAAMDGTNAWAAAIALGDLGPRSAAAVPVLTRALTSSAPGAQCNSANALGKIGPAAKSALPALERALTHEDRAVRRNAAMALWKIAERTNVVGVIIERLQSEDRLDVLERLNLKSTRLWDIKELGEIGPVAAPAIPVLQQFLAESDDDLRAAAQKAIQRIHPNSAHGEARPVQAFHQVFTRIEPLQIDLRRSQQRLFEEFTARRDEGIQFLLQRLGDQSDNGPAQAGADRAKAARLLARLNATDAIPALTQALEDAEGDVSEAAAQALGTFGEAAKLAVPALLEATKFRNSSAANALARIAPDSRPVAAALLEQMESSATDPGLRQSLIYALGEMKSQRDVIAPRLLQAARQADEWQRQSVSFALDRLDARSPEAMALRQDLRLQAAPLPSTDSLPELIEKLRTSAGGTDAVRVMNELQRFGPAASNAIPALVDYVRDPKARARGNAISTLGNMGAVAASAVPLLIDALSDDDLGASGNALMALGRIGPGAKSALPQIEPLVHSANPTTRIHATVSLVRIAPERAAEMIPLLIAEMDVQDSRWPERNSFIAAALGELGPQARAAEPQLERMVAGRQENERVALSAAAALCQIMPETRGRGLRLLTDALADTQGASRHFAASKLGELGAVAREAAPLLAAAAKEDDPFLREIASSALAKISPETK